MRQIPCSGTDLAKVDDQDYEYLSQFNWCSHRIKGLVYARRSGTVNGKRRRILMHREILKPADGVKIDHRDGDGLNNQRSNLRVASHAENMRNRRASSRNRTGFRGVSVLPTGAFRAEISIDHKKVVLGQFDTAEEAARAYDAAAKEASGEFARLNFPD